ncbi:hypothetical protein GGS21DRAFT_498206 [Xylaria nigripes]|nr:hypothetical protein GGS21DRAFT_498206 [Xylaria nigripes]
MCVKNLYTDVRSDGRHRSWSEMDYCRNIRAGLPCDGVTSLRHPPGYKRPEPRSPVTYNHGQLPPTPPRSYQSDHTSDSERSSKRRSSIYSSEHKPTDIGRRRSLRHERQTSRDPSSHMSSSPLSRTPPRHQPTMPASPISDSYEATNREADKHERPTSSHGQPSINIEIVNSRSHGHRRQSSSTKTSSSHGSADEGRGQRRGSDLQHDDQYLQRKKKESEIARQNEAIANRTPVPPAPSAPRYRRGSVAIPPILPVVEQRMRLEEEKEQRQRKKEAEAKEREADALKQRLKDRMSFKGQSYLV